MEVGRAVARLCLALTLLLSIVPPLHALELNGIASFSELGGEIYLAALFVDTATSDPAALFADSRERKMEIRFTDRMSKRRWTTSWMQSIAINNDRVDLVKAVDELSQIFSSFADNLLPGDRVEIHFVPGLGTAIRINGVTLASGKSLRAFNLFLSSWIGAVPPSSQFRNALLGKEDSSANRERFAAIGPAPARVAAVAGWTPADIPEAAPRPAEARPGEAVDRPGGAVARVDAGGHKTIAPLPQSRRAEQRGDGKDSTPDLSARAILAQQDYSMGLIPKIYSSLQYPVMAVKRGQEGTVRISLMVARDGSLRSMRLFNEAKYNILNREAVRAIEATFPFDPIPATIHQAPLEIMVPITFKLEK